jgi:hypothetical protein
MQRKDVRGQIVGACVKLKTLMSVQRVETALRASVPSLACRGRVMLLACFECYVLLCFPMTACPAPSSPSKTAAINAGSIVVTGSAVCPTLPGLSVQQGTQGCRYLNFQEPHYFVLILPETQLQRRCSAGGPAVICHHPAGVY